MGVAESLARRRKVYISKSKLDNPSKVWEDRSWKVRMLWLQRRSRNFNRRAIPKKGGRL